MRLPLPVQDDSCAKECPFYVEGTDNVFGCLLKTIVPKNYWDKISSTNLSEDFDAEFETDCGGNFDSCCFANEIWTGAIENNMNNIDDTEVKITIHKVNNPYQIKCDVLVYPTNNLLEIKDAALNRLSRNRVQQECDQFIKNNTVKMGHVYVTSNGNAQIAAKKIYHAVVAGESLLVNDGDLSNSVRKALILADNDEAEIVAILPPDVGKIDSVTNKGEYCSYESTASAQLNTLSQYLTSIGVESIKHILILTESELAYNIYVDQFSRTFGD